LIISSPRPPAKSFFSLVKNIKAGSSKIFSLPLLFSYCVSSPRAKLSKKKKKHGQLTFRAVFASSLTITHESLGYLKFLSPGNRKVFLYRASYYLLEYKNIFVLPERIARKCLQEILKRV
jgi:hypothetical protein